MRTSLFPASTAALALSFAQPAQAIELHSWGIGPRIGTTIVPAAYPSLFPSIVEEEGLIDKVRGDFLFGAQGLMQLDEHSRLNLLLGADAGKKFWDIHAIFTYDYLFPTGPVDFFLGGGVGVGQHMWGSDEDADTKFRVPNFPFRAETGLELRDDTRAYQLQLFFQYNLPSNQFYIKEKGGDPIDLKGSERRMGVYPTLGIELAVFFGDFTPSRPNRRAPGSKPAPR
jgi:hypothetical protein